MSQLTIWVALEGLGDAFGYGEGSRVVELKLSLPSAKPLTVAAAVPDGEGTVKISIG